MLREVTPQRRRDSRSEASQKYRKWYGSKRWKETRLRHLTSEPLCCFCLEVGKITAATVCDHVGRHRGDPEKFWNGPFQSLCKPHHDGTKQQIEVRGYSGDVGDDGWPSDDRHPANRWHGKQPLSYEVSERGMPSDLKPSAIPLTILCGPPGAGKSTYVRERIGPNDILIDLDAIQQELSGRAEHQTGSDFLVPALETRNRRLHALAHNTMHDRAWFIVPAPDPRERITWGKRLGAEVMTLDTLTGLHEVVRLEC